MAENKKEAKVVGMFDNGGEVTIEGTTYKLRRIGMPWAFRIFNMVTDLYTKGRENVHKLMPDLFLVKELVKLEGMTGEQLQEVHNFKDPVAAIVAMGINYIEEDFYDIAQYIFDVPRDDLMDPDKFPLSSFWDIIDALVSHPDFLSFLSRGSLKVPGILQRMTTMMVKEQSSQT
ncbi:MAG: hypothetical protein KDH96_02335 [Candidatus Riesia sp.]|nr:hypothetical protein [Candidatus Riesia sp.]